MAKKTEIQKGEFGYWQLCPKCNGDKIIFRTQILPNTSFTYGSQPCDICNGNGIIVRPIIKSNDIQG
jgi:DnaJ-class molecular chaperone